MMNMFCYYRVPIGELNHLMDSTSRLLKVLYGSLKRYIPMVKPERIFEVNIVGVFIVLTL